MTTLQAIIVMISFSTLIVAVIALVLSQNNPPLSFSRLGWIIHRGR